MSDVSRFPLSSADPDAERREQLKSLFPEAFPDGVFDVARLQAALGGEIPTTDERYGLNWAGKREAVRASQTVSVGTLRPARDESVTWDKTENVIIEGDNLEVLKLLQTAYHRQVKMIYIDPPYNTGNDFLYPDDFRAGLQTYLRFSGQVGENGVKMVANREENGRFHSDWLTMMLPRLHLAKNLLRDDGVIFVSINDKEVTNLHMVLDEVFGPENFLAEMVWHNSSRTTPYVSVEHEYILVYARSKDMLGKKWTRTRQEVEVLKQVVEDAQNQGESLEKALEKVKDAVKRYLKEDTTKKTKQYSWLTNYQNLDDDWRLYYPVDLSGEGSGPPRFFNGVETPAPAGRHWMSQEYIDDLESTGRIVWRGDRAYRKLYIEETEESLKAILTFPGRKGSEELKTLLGREVFSRECYELLIKGAALTSIRIANTTKCRAARVSGRRS